MLGRMDKLISIELSATGAMRGMRSLPIRNVPSWRSIYARPSLIQLNLILLVEIFKKFLHITFFFVPHMRWKFIRRLVFSSLWIENYTRDQLFRCWQWQNIMKFKAESLLEIRWEQKQTMEGSQTGILGKTTIVASVTMYLLMQAVWGLICKPTL